MIGFSPRWKFSVIVALAMASTSHAIYFVQRALIDQDSEQSRTAQIEHQLLDDRRKFANHDSILEQLKKMRVSLAKLEQRLPSHLNLAAEEATLRDQALHSRVEVTQLHFGAMILREGFYADTPAELMVKGNAANFVAFMYKLLGASPIRRIAWMKIEPINGSLMQARMAVMYESAPTYDVVSAQE